MGDRYVPSLGGTFVTLQYSKQYSHKFERKLLKKYTSERVTQII